MVVRRSSVSEWPEPALRAIKKRASGEVAVAGIGQGRLVHHHRRGAVRHCNLGINVKYARYHTETAINQRPHHRRVLPHDARMRDALTQFFNRYKNQDGVATSVPGFGDSAAGWAFLHATHLFFLDPTGR